MINLSMAEPDLNLRPRLTVMGVGGAGGNAINNMISCGLQGCDFIAANTDAQALAQSLAPRKIQLGVSISRGLGAGSKPDIGRGAAEEQVADILACLEGSDMLFITAGMGGGTGTGAAPVIARAAREAGILTVGVVTKPFHFEGGQRMRKAEAGIAELQQYVDTLIVIPNQNLFRIANERTTFAEAFRLADEVLHSGVRGITDLMVMPGFMNLDFADVKTVMDEMGKAMMGTGEAEGENRAVLAAEAAISNPLLDDVSMKGARGVLINITGGMDMTLFEVDQAANRIREEVDPDAQIKVGSTLGENLEGRIRVSVIATGIDANIVSPGRSGGSGRGIIGNVQAVHGNFQAPDQTAIPIAAQTQYFTMPPTVTPQMVAQQQAHPQAQLQAQQPVAHLQTAAAPLPPLPQVPVMQQQQAAPQQHAAYQPAPAAPPSPPQPRHQVEMPHVPPAYAAPQRTAAPVHPPIQARAATQPAQSPHAPFDMRVTQLTTPAQQSAADMRRARRSESLFTRITGFGIARPSVQQEEEAMEAAASAAEADVQQRLGIDPSDRPALSSPEASDMLDIPAFLRRQTTH